MTNNYRVFIFAALFGLGGVLFLLLASAASPNSSGQLESGTTTVPVKKITDATASGGEAVVFHDDKLARMTGAASSAVRA